MADRGHVFRRAFSWLPAQFASQSSAPVGAPRQFGSTEHLSPEAVAAFVDGELRMNAHLRAAHHLSLCPQCAAEVEGQSRARSALRDSCPIRVPSSLLGALSQIPYCPPDSPAADRSGDDASSAGGTTRSQWAAPGGVGERDRSGQLADGSTHDRRKRR